MTSIRRTFRALAGVAVVVALGTLSYAQVGTGLLDPNVATEAQLTALPNMTPAIAKGVIAQRPFMSIVDFNKFLIGQGLTQAQASEIYQKAFIHLNLNTTIRDEIMLIPGGSATRMAREIPEYRPWTSWAQWDKEIGKYFKSDPNEVQRLKQYVFIPIDINTATDDVLMTIPGMTPRWVREFKEYRPWTSKAQFEKEIGKYIKGNPKEVERLWRYVVIK